MQLLQGESLENRILRQGRLPAGDAVRFGRQIAEGLAAAHAHGLIHRDIKPGNIFLEKPRDRVKILDFGLARLSEGKSNLSQTGQFIGTPYYMSPEQARGDTIDARSDLFSLGCVLYVMLGGKLPFDGSHAMAVLTALAVQEPESLARIAPETPGPLIELVHRLLSKQADDRPASAQVVAEMLEVMERGATLAVGSGAASMSAPDTRDQLTVPDPPSNPRMNTPGPSPFPTVRTPPPGQSGTVPASVASPPPPLHQSPWIAITGLALVAIAALVGIGLLLRTRSQPGVGTVAAPSGEPILVGVLHSQTGTMRESETPVLDMTRLALEELNEQGGLLGRPIKIITRDGASEEAIFAREADRLIHQDKVSVLFGCWTSASRKAVKAVVEEHDHLLIYPLQYEGLEQSPNIVYTGATPDQQVFPAVDWCLKKGFKKFFLVGSDYVYPRAVHAIVRDRLATLGAEVVGEEYLPLGSTVVDPIVTRIQRSQADVVLNTINGDSNLPFFRELREKGVSPRQTPVICFSLDESSLKNFNPRHVTGHYAAWSYFQSISSPINERFVARYRAAYGDYKTVTDPMQSAWLGVQFWAKAVAEAGSERPTAVRRAIAGQEVDAPEGPRVHVDPETQHTWKYFRLARISDKAEFEIVFSSDVLDSPEPFPTSRPRKVWEQFLQNLYKGWGNRWSSPGE
jgi:urea transport system substrate-binding protein